MIGRILRNKLSSSSKSTLLLGPRQVGKSTVCRALGPAAVIDLADERQYRQHLSDAGLIFRIMETVKPGSLVLVDEVQRVPSILNSIQSLIDQHSGIKFMLTGSSARKLRRGNANLLPGRVFVEHMPPLVFWEIADRFQLDRALRLGSLPEVYLNDYGEKLLDSYVDTYLREEIQAEAATRDLGAYARFLELAAELHGQFLNYAKLSSDAEIKKETVRRYFAILEDTLLVERIPSFDEVKDKRRVRQRDRFLFFDLGVRNALLGRHHLIPSKTETGFLFEQWLTLQALQYSRLFDKRWQLSTFCSTSDQEVDLVIDTGTKLLAIECKYRSQVDERMTSGLDAFEQLTKSRPERLIVYDGTHRQKLGDRTLALPYKEFLTDFLPSL